MTEGRRVPSIRINTIENYHQNGTTSTTAYLVVGEQQIELSRSEIETLTRHLQKVLSKLPEAPPLGERR
jgi:hypothetical protein